MFRVVFDELRRGSEPLHRGKIAGSTALPAQPTRPPLPIPDFHSCRAALEPLVQVAIFCRAFFALFCGNAGILVYHSKLVGCGMQAIESEGLIVAGQLESSKASSQVRETETKSLQVGQRVIIEDGPLLGLEGSMVEERSTRVVLSVQLVKTVALVELDRQWIRPLAAPKKPVI